ncbi:MAG: DUF512 domain-containing protein [Anaerotignaceae bacterium]
MKKENVIIKVEKNTIAHELGIEAGDILVSINGEAVEDIFDYRYLINDEYVEMVIKTVQGEECILEIEKDYDEDIGIIFEDGLMDDAKSCTNKCIFCFIDQLPKGMRETLYFKDDDSRLSFLQGNYVTLTNMKQKDIDRIVYYHLSPINISVHTTDLELRKKMLNNKNADKVLEHMKTLSQAGIEMNLQIVLCKGVNDGEVLEKSIEDLAKFHPKARSLSVVPIGITRYRENLYEAQPFTKEDSINVIKIIEKWQKKLKAELDSNFVFIADEFYLTAEMEIPSAEEYEDFPQIENGVGMMSLMKEEFYEFIEDLKPNNVKAKTVSIATGTVAYDFIKHLADELTKKVPQVKINVYAIENNFFGGKISVAGLLCGCDIIEQLKGKELGEYLCLSQNLLRSGEETLLDDITVSDIEKALNIKVKISSDSGGDFIKAVI